MSVVMLTTKNEKCAMATVTFDSPMEKPNAGGTSVSQQIVENVRLMNISRNEFQSTCWQQKKGSSYHQIEFSAFCTASTTKKKEEFGRRMRD